MDYLEQLRRLPLERCAVEHNPPTPRYGRAQHKLPQLIRDAAFLGARQGEGGVEMAVWSRPGHGRGPGIYGCFRLYIGDSGGLTFAVLFCFYDGRDGSPGFRSVEAARRYAREQGFTVE